MRPFSLGKPGRLGRRWKCLARLGRQLSHAFAEADLDVLVLQLPDAGQQAGDVPAEQEEDRKDRDGPGEGLNQRRDERHPSHGAALLIRRGPPRASTRAPSCSADGASAERMLSGAYTLPHAGAISWPTRQTTPAHPPGAFSCRTARRAVDSDPTPSAPRRASVAPRRRSRVRRTPPA